MADVNAARAATATLVADTVDTVTLSNAHDKVEITHHGDATEPIYCRAVTDPTVAGEDCDVILAGQRIIVGSASGKIKLISSGVPTYTVSAF
jgi:poly-beta-hydroxyalkanoate depolymerase